MGWSRLERQTSWVSPLEKNFLLTEHLVPVSGLTFSIRFAEQLNQEYMQNCMRVFLFLSIVDINTYSSKRARL